MQDNEIQKKYMVSVDNIKLCNIPIDNYKIFLLRDLARKNKLKINKRNIITLALKIAYYTSKRMSKAEFEKITGFKN